MQLRGLNKPSLLVRFSMNAALTPNPLVAGFSFSRARFHSSARYSSLPPGITRMIVGGFNGENFDRVLPTTSFAR